MAVCKLSQDIIIIIYVFFASQNKIAVSLTLSTYLNADLGVKLQGKICLFLSGAFLYKNWQRSKLLKKKKKRRTKASNGETIISTQKLAKLIIIIKRARHRASNKIYCQNITRYKIYWQYMWVPVIDMSLISRHTHAAFLSILLLPLGALERE